MTGRNSRPARRNFMRAVGVAALCVSASGGCHGESPAASTPNDHYVSGVIAIIYADADGTPVLQEAEVLVDGERVGHQSFVPGADRAFFNFEATFRAAGSHRVSVRVVRQSRTTVDYVINGGLAAARLSVGASSVVNYSFGSTAIRSMRAGDQVESVVDVP